ncbi:MAG: tRNA (guanine(10)-N(2))-dimethyltransferase [archaeon]|jgi:tRNA (guanine26-N2/guanine27-N2)-dimethyltransferase|nr:tRNA (guanine(10)-N(2))-dimethyltransferase [Euryarchaeota archaeon]MDP6704561.1 tRNA (guanine(10)-N(2))-dimethyltransferase [archaeon]|tara:strand:- start:21310 stop:22377 length:1068 start_codon:yes stop_codon:yes gene_type:complete
MVANKTEIKENGAKILVQEGAHTPEKTVGFYNARMEFNRDFTIATLSAEAQKGWKVLDAFGASGVRGIRLAQEIEDIELTINDISKGAVELIKRNVKRNKVSAEILQRDAAALMNERKFDFIDLDPFGSPSQFLEPAFRSIRNKGIVGMTATDMTALCGVYPKVAERNYGGRSLRTEYCHELGARLVIAATARAAARFEKRIEVLSVLNADHYLRITLRARDGAEGANKCLTNIKQGYHCFKCNEHGFEKKCRCRQKITEFGPVWSGPIFEKKFINESLKTVKRKNFGTEKRLLKTLEVMKEEIRSPAFYYDLHKHYKGNVPKISEAIEKLKKQGIKATRTHFSPTAIKSEKFKK